MLKATVTTINSSGNICKNVKYNLKNIKCGELE